MFEEFCSKSITGRKLDSVYVMSAESAYVEKTCQSDTSDLWHTLLGHVGLNKIRMMISRSMLKSLQKQGKHTYLEVHIDTVCVEFQ